MSRIGEIKKMSGQIQRLIENNDLEEKTPWINDIYLLADKIEDATIALESSVIAIEKQIKELSE